MGVQHHLNPRLVRGLDYYTRTVFEIVAEEKLGSQDTVCAGGRYDKLVEECGGPPTPAVGWAFGEERLAILLESKTPSDVVDLYVAAMGPDAEVASFKLAHALRQLGDWRVEVGFGDRKLKKQLEMADKLGARWVAVIGETELAAGEVQLKDLVARTACAVAMDAESLASALTAPLPESVS
ncbi:Histidine--tRNA ligase [compost metagenome]